MNDFEIDGYKDIFLFKYVDDLIILVMIFKDFLDIFDIVLFKFMDWIFVNDMYCNISKCKELIMCKRGNLIVYLMFYNIK